MPADLPDMAHLVREKWAASLVGCCRRTLRQRRDAGELSCWQGPNGGDWYDARELPALLKRTHAAGGTGGL
jgi:hypothetical protein